MVSPLEDLEKRHWKEPIDRSAAIQKEGFHSFSKYLLSTNYMADAGLALDTQQWIGVSLREACNPGYLSYTAQWDKIQDT